MRTFLYFLWIVMSLSLFAESFIQNQEKNTIKLLHALGRKACQGDVEKEMSHRFMSLPKKKEEISQALKITYNSTFELFKKKNMTLCHWKNDAFQNLMGHLNRQAQSRVVSQQVQVVSSELETFVEDFKKLDQFLTQQNFSCCAWETVRHYILVIMDHFRNMTRPRGRHV